MIGSLITSIVSLVSVFAALPASTNYQLNSYGFGSGGVANATSSNYALEGITGEVDGGIATSSNYKTLPGFVQTQQAHVPTVTLSNPSSYYDKLKFVIGQQSNPADATYALQISTTSDFSSNINYVKSDLTIGPTLTLADYQTYSAWGGASGANITGLSTSTTYYLRAKATQGKFTESGYGPSSSAATVGAQLSFDIDISSTDSDTSPPYTVALGNLPPGTVTTGSDKVWFDFATNGNSGGKIYIYSLSGGLNSAARAYTITSATGDLASLEEGFGAQSSSVSQSSGGPISAVSPYNATSENVGIINATIREIYTSANPITAGRTSALIKAKSKSITPPATDYAETLTAIASGNF